MFSDYGICHFKGGRGGAHCACHFGASFNIHQHSIMVNGLLSFDEP